MSSCEPQGLGNNLSTLKLNIIANIFGGAWIAFLTVVITPLQVHILGIEAYGLVGLIAILQVVLGALDLGLSTTMTKVVSADQSEKFSASQNLVRSSATLYWGMAFTIAVFLWLNSSWIAGHWLKPSSISAETVTLSVRIIAVYLALRWPVAFYTGIITGLQRMDILNLIKAGVASVRLVGGVIVLLVLPKLEAFLLWFALSAGLELAVYVVIGHRLMPTLTLRPYFSFASIRTTWKFSAAMSLIALMSMLLTQLDRLVVSKLLSLEALGLYSLAYSTASVVSLLQAAINSASLPALSKAHSREQAGEFIARYEKTSQLMGYAMSFFCGVLVFFGYNILEVWISKEVAEGGYLSLAVLSCGFFLNAMVSNAYIATLAFGKPNLPLKVNLLGLPFYMLALYWMISVNGILGAAICWFVLNLYYFFSLFPLVQIRLLRQKMGPWLMRNLFSFLVTGIVTFGGAKILVAALGGGWIAWPALVVAAAAYVVLGYFWLANGLRSDMRTLMKNPGRIFAGRTF